MLRRIRTRTSRLPGAFSTAAATVVALAVLVLPAAGPRAEPDLRSSIVDLEWNTPSGYERCAGVVTAMRHGELLVWTAERCTTNGIARVRFFDGRTVPGRNVRVVRVSASSGVAEIAIAVDSRELNDATTARVTFAAPGVGTNVTIIGHPVSALRGPREGRWTTTYGRFGETARNDGGDEQYEIFCHQCGPGNSGSGTFDERGRLIGVVYGVTPISGMGRLPNGPYADVVPSAIANRVARSNSGGR